VQSRPDCHEARQPHHLPPHPHLSRYITWFCFLTIAFWAYSSAVHKFEDVAKQIDEFSVQIYEVGFMIFTSYIQQQIMGAAVGGTKTKKEN
jgi:hypothetical protein